VKRQVLPLRSKTGSPATPHGRRLILLEWQILMSLFEHSARNQAIPKYKEKDILNL
jgi:hypothetical protein